MQIVPRRMGERDGWFVFFLLASLAPFWPTLRKLVNLALDDDRYSNVLLIPPIAASLVYLQRTRIFNGAKYCLSKAVPFVVAGIALFYLAQTGVSGFNPDNRLTIAVLAVILVWMGGFILCYGARSFGAALFPWLFLLLMIPLPSAAMDMAVLAMRQGSAVMTYSLFKLLGVPVLWQHFQFSLPGVEVEIAQECSGIRSNLALVTTSILAGHMFLQSNWKRALLTCLSVPVVIFKNAVRIVTISCLGIYVDPGFLHGNLHRYGGLPFSLISLGMLLALLLMLQQREIASPTKEHVPNALGAQVEAH